MLTEICCIGRGLYGLLFHGELNWAGTFAKKSGPKLSDKYIVLALNLYSWICYNVVRAARKRFIRLFSNILNFNLMGLYTMGQGIKPRIGYNHPPSYPDIASHALFHSDTSNLIMISPYLYNTVGHSFTLRHYRNSERNLSPSPIVNVGVSSFGFTS